MYGDKGRKVNVSAGAVLGLVYLAARDVGNVPYKLHIYLHSCRDFKFREMSRGHVQESNVRLCAGCHWILHHRDKEGGDC